MIGYIPKPKPIDNSFLRNNKRTSFNYYNYASKSDKMNLKDKYLNEGYLALSFTYTQFRSYIYVYDFYNFEILTDGNIDIDHNIEICNAKKTSKYDSKSRKTIDIVDTKNILNCAHNLSPSSRMSNQQLKKGLSTFSNLIANQCDRNCSLCRLVTSTFGNNILINYSNINNIIFPSIYTGLLFLDDDFTIKYNGIDKSKGKIHIDRFRLNINKDAYLEIQKNLTDIFHGISISYTNAPRFYTTYLALEKYKSSQNPSLTLKRMMNNIEIKLKQIG